MNFGDEAMWSSNFASAAAEAKKLGVQAVRLWIGLDSYDARPNAWDEVPAFGLGADGKPQVGNAGRTMNRAFELAAMGFKVLLVLNNNTGAVPDSAEQVRGLVRHLMNSTQTPDSTTTLASVVDQWEIGNEVDQSFYWQPSGVNKVAGLTSYVDNFLIPAADELHSDDDPANWEKVVSAGVSYNPADVKTILDVLAARNALGDVDYVGFHPYAAYDSSTPSVNPIKDNTLLAKSYANAVGKSMIATEWNVRGFGNAGANDAKWAQAADEIYRTVIAPNFSTAYYFGLLNNWAARGGTVSARPGGVLKHDTTLAVTPTSSLADLETYYNSPLIAAEPFYSMVGSWSGFDPDAVPVTPPPPPAPVFGSISGYLFNDGNADGIKNNADAFTGARVVFLDTNGNGKLDTGERQMTSDATGNYRFDNLPAGTYNVYRVFPSGYRLSTGTNGKLTVTIAEGQNLTGVNVGTTSLPAPVTPPPVTPPPVTPPVTPPPVTPPPVTPPAGTASISGKVFPQASKWNALAAAASWAVFLDANKNGQLDAGEIYTAAKTDLTYAFTGLAAGTYTVALKPPAGWNIFTPASKTFSVTLKATTAKTGQNFVVVKV